jgi:hypothetical protein
VSASVALTPAFTVILLLSGADATVTAAASTGVLGAGSGSGSGVGTATSGSGDLLLADLLCWACASWAWAWSCAEGDGEGGDGGSCGGGGEEGDVGCTTCSSSVGEDCRATADEAIVAAVARSLMDAMVSWVSLSVLRCTRLSIGSKSRPHADSLTFLHVINQQLLIDI